MNSPEQHCLLDEKQVDFLDRESRSRHKEMKQLILAVDTLTREVRALQEQLKPKKRVQGVPKARHEYDPDFENAWGMYPIRKGGNSKFKAEKAWKARLSLHPDDTYKMTNGTILYHKFCKATGKVGTEYVMQAATFFGPARHYLEDWTLPEPEKKQMSRKELAAHYEKLGMGARPGEDWDTWLRRVQGGETP